MLDTESAGIKVNGKPIHNIYKYLSIVALELLAYCDELKIPKYFTTTDD